MSADSSHGGAPPGPTTGRTPRLASPQGRSRGGDAGRAGGHSQFVGSMRHALPPGPLLLLGLVVCLPRATGPREGVIVNELFEDEEGALQLRFYCYLGLRGKEPGGPEEQAEQAQFDGSKGYKAALLSTLKRTRELLAEGAL